MKKFVVMSGGFHPFHAGHASLYQQAKEAFPDATVLVCATNVQSDRPFPFSLKKKLAQLSGVPPKDFIEVSRQFTIQDPALAKRIGNPDDAIVIYVRSDKDRNEAPQPWKLGPDGKPPVGKKGKPLSNYLLEYPSEGQSLEPASKHAYMAYLQTVEFGPGITSASEIRNTWPTLNDKRKLAMVMSLYPATKSNPKLAQNVVGMFDQVMGGQVDEGIGKALGTAALAGSLALGGLSQMGKTTNTNWNDFPQEISGHRDTSGDEEIMSVAGPNSKGEYRVRITTANDMQEFITKTPPKSLKEARRNPNQNMRSGSGKYDLINYAEDNINDKDNWAVSMTMEPKLGINPRAAVSEDTPKGIYFYPLRYFMQMADRDESLPWGDNMPYLQLFQYDRSGEMTKETKVDPAKLKQALLQYCPEEVIQQVSEEGEYDGTPYWFIYDCLSRLGKGDETNVIRWNKVLRDLGFTSVYDPGHGWIAYNEPTQGVVLDPRIIKQHKMFDNRNPTLQNRRYDIQGLADSIGWSSYYQRESQSQRIYNHPDEKKVMLDVAKSMLKPFLGKSSEEAKEMGYDNALKAAADKVIEILKQDSTVSEDKESDPITSTVLSFYKPVVNDIHKEKLPDYVDQARGLLQKTNDPDVRSKLVDIFKKGKENPYMQGGIVTTVGAVLAGGVLSTAQNMGLSPAQTNLALQAILNTVIPTVVSRINGKSWSDTIKYTLASAGIGTGIAGASLVENNIPEPIDYLEEK